MHLERALVSSSQRTLTINMSCRLQLLLRSSGPERSSEFDQARSGQFIEYFINSLPRPRTTVCDALHTAVDLTGPQVILVQQELVRRLRFNTPRGKVFLREILVLGNNDLGAALDGCG